ncbi:MAG: hypothetical protein QXL38_03305 [Candidatus Bathyarchaeia archaeon]
MKRIERILGQPVVETYQGGKAGGGGVKLTTLGKELLKEYKRVERLLNKVLAFEGQ